MLKKFYDKLYKNFKGSLVTYNHVKNIDKNAKEYLNQLADKNKIDEIITNWYYIKDNFKDEIDFLSKDKNFKIISGISAASFWNYEFIQHNVCRVLVNNKEYAKTLEKFSEKHNLKINVIYSKNLPKYIKADNLLIETIEYCIIDCLTDYAFIDAFSTIYEQKKDINLENLLKLSYHKTLPNSNIKLNQILYYAFNKFNEISERRIFADYNVNLKDHFIKRSLDEAIEKILDF